MELRENQVLPQNVLDGLGETERLALNGIYDPDRPVTIPHDLLHAVNELVHTDRLQYAGALAVATAAAIDPGSSVTQRGVNLATGQRLSRQCRRDVALAGAVSAQLYGLATRYYGMSLVASPSEVRAAGMAKYIVAHEQALYIRETLPGIRGWNDNDLALMDTMAHSRLI